MVAAKTAISAKLNEAAALAKQSDHSAALALIDTSLASLGEARTPSIIAAAATAVRLANELALGCMRDPAVTGSDPSADQLEAAYGYLKWALKVPHASPALRAVTLNNAGIYYTHTGQPEAALRCLERVSKSSPGVVLEDDVSVHVCLNMTTVLAALGRHAEALAKAQQAVRTLTRTERTSARSGVKADPSLLSAAYHNLAVQQERLGSSTAHVRSHKAAAVQARRSGERGRPMASYMEHAYNQACNQAYNQARVRTEATGGGAGGGAGGGGGRASSARLPSSVSAAADLPPLARAPASSRPWRARQGRPTGRPTSSCLAPSTVMSYSSSAGFRSARKPSCRATSVSLKELYSGALGAAPPPPQTVAAGRGATCSQPIRRNGPRSAGSARLGPAAPPHDILTAGDAAAATSPSTERPAGSGFAPSSVGPPSITLPGYGEEAYMGYK